MTSDLDILAGYIRTELDYDGPLDPEADLLEAHILDSFNIVQMAMFIQETFGVELDGEDLVRANLARLSSMVALIARKRAAAAPRT